MKIIHTNFDKLLILNIEEITDKRGSFMKLFNEDVFLENNIDLKVKEYYQIKINNTYKFFFYNLHILL